MDQEPGLDVTAAIAKFLLGRFGTAAIYAVGAAALALITAVGALAFENRGLDRDLALAGTRIAELQRDIERKNVEIETANSRALATAADLTARSAADVAAIDSKYRETLDAKSRLERDLSALRAGTLQLRRDLAASACAVAAGGAEAGTGAGLGDGARAGDLWRARAEEELRDADHADQVVRKLTACQAIVRSDREVLNRANGG